MYLVLVLFLLMPSSQSAKDNCETCKTMTDKFREGMERTSGHNFGGGNTDWEETRLGSFADSETRLVDIMENICSSTECHSLVEEHEEDIETWWFKEKSNGIGLESWLCIDTIKACCPKGKFGPNCEDCPGGSDKPCLNRGACKGDGSRSGSGECDCDEGFTGKTCDECDEGFYQDTNSTSELKCLKCHESCDGACHDGSPKGCETCKDGWEDTEEHGCSDKNECELKDICDSKEYCVNTPGSFKCEACDKSCEENCTGSGPKGCVACKVGYEMTDSEGCKDKDECKEEGVTCEDGKHCSNTPGSYECVACHKACMKCTESGSEKCTECSEGYELTEKGCSDVDECKNESACTGENETCKNTAGSYSCKCSQGFKRKEGKCVKGKKKKKRSKKKSSEDDELLAELQKGNYFQEWHLKFGSLLYAFFFGFLVLAFMKRSVVGFISLVVAYVAILWYLKTVY